MNKSEAISNRYLSNYGPLVSKFIQDAQTMNMDGMPEPFLPVFGPNYAKSKFKIALAGMETNGWGDMNNFIDRYKSGFQVGKYDEFDSDVLSAQNGLRAFWRFATRFLALCHGVDHQTLLDDEDEDILQSFVWGNCNSVERFHVTAKGHGVTSETWQVIKDASSPFDHGKHIIDVFKPDVLLIMWWSPDESYLTDMMGPPKVRKVIADSLLYMEFEGIDTRVIWTAHPRSLRFDEIEDSTLARCVSLAKHGLDDCPL